MSMRCIGPWVWDVLAQKARRPTGKVRGMPDGQSSPGWYKSKKEPEARRPRAKHYRHKYNKNKWLISQIQPLSCIAYLLMRQLSWTVVYCEWCCGASGKTWSGLAESAECFERSGGDGEEGHLSRWGHRGSGSSHRATPLCTALVQTFCMN